MAKPLALTLGEPAGIGPDIAIAAWQRRKEAKLPPFYLLGDSGFIRRRAHALGIDLPLADVRPEDACSAFAEVLPVVGTGHAVTSEPGRPDDSSADAALASIRQAVADVSAGRASAVVTNPKNEQRFRSKVDKHSGKVPPSYLRRHAVGAADRPPS